MKAIYLLVALFKLSPVFCSSKSPSRPREIILERDPGSGSCSVIAARDTQLFRNLPPGDSHVSRRRTPDDKERLSIIASDDSIVLNRARSLCLSFHDAYYPADSTDATVDRFATQGTFSIFEASGLRSTLPQAPDLKIEPLIVSGPSDNRVDLVFFSDGCEYLRSVM